ncbi:hypothetical protein VTO42DRAFT_76 [Malbranchea cinnamomea]
MELEKWRIEALPESAYYIPDFITPEEEERLLRKINSAPVPRWTQLSRRRLQTWPSALTKTNTLLAAPLPEWLVSPIIPRFDRLRIFSSSPHKAPNHVLINEYMPGEGIMPHEDGAAYHPIVATVSLGAPIVLDIYDKRKEDNESSTATREPRYRILQEPRSLLVTTEKMYTDYLHGIAEKLKDENLNCNTICNWKLLGNPDRFEVGGYERSTRTSLTYRDVLKVSKLGNSIKFFPK